MAILAQNRRKRHFPAIWDRMRKQGLTIETLAHEISRTTGKPLRCPAYWGKRMSGARDWSLEDIWDVVETLGAEAEDMAELFPAPGRRTA